jgi:hypothetical protein
MRSAMPPSSRQQVGTWTAIWNTLPITVPHARAKANRYSCSSSGSRGLTSHVAATTRATIPATFHSAGAA